VTSATQAIEHIGTLAKALPAFPEIVLKLLGQLRDEQASMDLIGRTVRSDPVLSGHVLALANHVRRLHAQSDLADPLAAAALIGLNHVRRIVVAAGMNRFLASAAGSTFFLRHSTAVAFASQEMAVLCGAPPDAAYVAGILHDVGQLCFSVLDERAFQQAYADSGSDGRLIEREAAIFGIDHCQIGERLARHWKLPDDVVAAIRTHHDADGATSALQAAVCIGETLARALDIPASAKNRVTQINADALALLQIRWDAPEMLDCFGRCRARYRHAFGPG
jgi:putative nucleotidyltransferase with HDIG domain